MAHVLVVGSGGREHAMAWKLCQSPKVSKVTVAPGNAATQGTAALASKMAVPSGRLQCVVWDTADFPGLSDYCKLAGWCEANVQLVAVGPEAPLANGIADSLSDRGVACFGPSQDASQIESSKAFAKQFMLDYGIPTAHARCFTDISKAKQHVIKNFDKGCVIKASGLAAGKGVIIASSLTEALSAVDEIMGEGHRFGSAGDTVVVEEFLDGFEVSCLGFTDGQNIKCMPLAQDHKKVFDGEKGPNTGGMGAYAPCPLVDRETEEEIQHIMHKTVLALGAAGRPFVGVLFGGFMVTKDGPKVLEFNCRLGDPETQVLMPLLNSDLYDVMLACVNGSLDQQEVVFDERKSAVAIVAASAGYPGSYPKGLPITGLDMLPTDVHVFHAGTALNGDNHLVTSGGRVLAVVALEHTLEHAAERALNCMSRVKFDGVYYRTDIGRSATESTGSASLTYADTGVNVDAGTELVNCIAPACRETEIPGCVGNLGMFGSVFDLKLTEFKDPLLISGTDGVGTKLLLALECKFHRTIGQDLVAMCVNDILCHGARPLFFLDYFATGCLHVSVAREVIVGTAEACKIAGCALVGGETAEMPDMYPSGKYDLAGFAVGAVERESYLPRTSEISAGDVVIGLPSSGVHSNGFSLVRKIIKESKYSYKDKCPFDASMTIGEMLLTPTKIYTKDVLQALNTGSVKAVSHITGGGLLENIPRVLPSNVKVKLDSKSWTVPPVFPWLQAMGNVSDREMYRTFNCGLGMVLIASQSNASSVCSDTGGQVVGQVTSRAEGEAQVEITSTAAEVKHEQKRVAVIISGTGTNLQALIDSCQSPSSHAKIVLVVSNKAAVQGLERAKAAGIPTKVISHVGYSRREMFDCQITEALEAFHVEIVCLAGFMRLLSGQFVNRWSGRLINIHPSLLPSFKGIHAHQQALDAGVKVTGCTVHFVEEEVDSGKIIDQQAVAVEPGDTVESLQVRIKAAEHQLFPRALQKLAKQFIEQGE